MNPATELLPISTVVEPTGSDELAAAVRDCHDSDSAVYPIGGGTSLDFGWPAKKRGVGLSLTRLNRVIEYPVRDLTITVEAGISIRSLAELLAKERQRLPIDVPKEEHATLGGVVATNFNGPRRFGQGTVRDYVLGISAVDGRGMPFKGGGRVVKNVAGYDFCKLLTGSLGTLGVITQLTMRLKPIPEKLAFLVTSARDCREAEKILAALVHSKTAPTAIELLAGAAWSKEPAFAELAVPSNSASLFLAVALEGTDAEVGWMIEQLSREWWDQGIAEQRTLLGADADLLLRRCIEFPAAEAAPIVLKASVRPSGVTSFITTAQQLDPHCTIAAHAGNGIVIVRLSQAPTGGLTKGLIGTLQSSAAAAHGSLVVLASASAAESTHQSIWGSPTSPQSLLTAVKREFDPRNILNPDRFVYAGY